MLGTARILIRLIAMLRLFAAHDALFALQPLPWGRGLRLLGRLLGGGKRAVVAGLAPGDRLAAALTALGPSFIKFGQALSVRPDLIGDDIAERLAALQDRLPPFPGAEARAAIEAELDRPVAEVFASFDDIPVAAASIAQVHFATTANGAEVAVKVLRPGIEAALARDIETMIRLAGMIERWAPALRRLKPVAVVRVFADTVDAEIDLRLEAAAADELRQNFADDPAYRVPSVDWTRTARRVLTLERVSGIPIDERAALIAAGHDVAAIVANMARVFFIQTFRDGFFHADLHPGNLFVDRDGAVVAVDFGIMGRLDKRTRGELAEMLLGFLDGDYQRVAKVHVRAGYLPAGQSVDSFAQSCRAIAEPILGLPLHSISLARLLAQLFQVTTRFHMETQPQLLLLQKTMLVAEGVGRTLYPEANIWALARPLIEDWIAAQMAPEARLRDVIETVGRSLERLPALIGGIADSVGALTPGGIRLHPDSVRALRGQDQAGPGARPLWLAVAAAAAIALFLL